MASAVVFPLCVGSDHHDRLGPFRRHHGRMPEAVHRAQGEATRMGQRRGRAAVARRSWRVAHRAPRAGGLLGAMET